MYSVLIISVATDVHANIVEDLLKKRGGVNIIRLNTDRFIFDNFELSFGFDDNETLSILDKEVCLSDIKGVLYRRPSIPQVDVKLPGQKILWFLFNEMFYNGHFQTWGSLAIVISAGQLLDIRIIWGLMCLRKI